MDLSKIIIKPVITEKSMAATANGGYTFIVDKKASKPQIKKAIEDLFKVKIVSIKTMTVKGKTKIAGRSRRKIKTSDFKKTVVFLKKDQKIEIFETGK